MAQRTYAPQFARMLQKALRYYDRHQPKIAAVASTDQNTDAEAIATAIRHSWNTVTTVEQP